MSHSYRIVRLVPYFTALCLCACAARASGAPADPKPPVEEKRVPAGKAYSPLGSLLERDAPSKPWKLVDSLDAVYTGDSLLTLPGGRAVIGSKNNAVRLTLVGNLPQLYPIPSLESIVRLHESADYDLDLTLVRGGVKVTNRKEKGASRIHVRLPGADWDLSLLEPGDEAAVELHGRWAEGVPFTKDPKNLEPPTSLAVLLLLKGNATLKAGFEEYVLRAPPGAALYQWSSDGNVPASPSRLEQLPEWLQTKGPNCAEARRAGAARDKLIDMMKHPGANALDDFYKAAVQDTDKDRGPVARAVAVCSMGAMDDLIGLMNALESSSAEVRNLAVVALRHHLGSGPGQDLALYDFLVKQRKYSEAHADIVLQLLHSFGQTELSKVETYETLISYLKHPKLPVRELAWWHLIRHVPEGDKIPYDPGAAPEDREKGYQAWKKLLDDKKLPPTAKPGDK
jgi:hypothetical protein